MAFLIPPSDREPEVVDTTLLDTCPDCGLDVHANGRGTAHPVFSESFNAWWHAGCAEERWHRPYVLTIGSGYEGPQMSQAERGMNPGTDE